MNGNGEFPEKENSCTDEAINAEGITSPPSKKSAERERIKIGVFLSVSPGGAAGKLYFLSAAKSRDKSGKRGIPRRTSARAARFNNKPEWKNNKKQSRTMTAAERIKYVVLPGCFVFCSMFFARENTLFPVQ